MIRGQLLVGVPQSPPSRVSLDTLYERVADETRPLKARQVALEALVKSILGGLSCMQQVGADPKSPRELAEYQINALKTIAKMVDKASR